MSGKTRVNFTVKLVFERDWWGRGVETQTIMTKYIGLTIYDRDSLV